MYSNQVGVFENNDFCSLKLTGELRFSSAGDVEKGLVSIKQAKQKEILLDLTMLTYLDSTILGLLIGFFLNENRHRFSLHKPTVICNNSIKKFFERICVDSFFTFKTVDPRLKSLPYKQIESFTVSKEDLKKQVLRAHESLDAFQSQEGFDQVVRMIKNTKKA